MSCSYIIPHMYSAKFYFEIKVLIDIYIIMLTSAYHISLVVVH